MPGQRRKSRVQLVAEIEQGARLFGDVLLGPREGDRLEHRPEVDRGSQGDASTERVLEQARIGFQRRGEQRFARDEAHDELGTGRQSRPVLFLRESVDVRANRLHVLAEEALAARSVVSGGGERNRARLEVGIQGDLRVDGDRLLAGQAHDHIGSAGAGIGVHGCLQVEVDVSREPGCLDDASQLRLSPDAAGAPRTQCARERLRGRSQLLVGFVRPSQLLGESAELVVPVPFQLIDLALHGLQSLVHRRKGAENRLLSALAIVARREVGSRLGRQLPIQQLLVIELRLHPLPRGVRGGDLGAQVGDLRVRTRRGSRPAGGPAGQKAREQCRDGEEGKEHRVHADTLSQTSDTASLGTRRRVEAASRPTGPPSRPGRRDRSGGDDGGCRATCRGRCDLRDPHPGRLREGHDVGGAGTARGIHHHVRAGERVGSGVVVREGGETGLGGDERQAIRLERVHPAGHLKAAGVPIGRALVTGRLACALDDGHVEAGVVGDEDVLAHERGDVRELLGPRRRIRNVPGLDSVDAGVQFEERIVTDRWPDQPSGLRHDLSGAHTDESDGAGRCAAGIRRLEVDRREIQ